MERKTGDLRGDFFREAREALRSQGHERLPMGLLVRREADRVDVFQIRVVSFLRVDDRWGRRCHSSARGEEHWVEAAVMHLHSTLQHVIIIRTWARLRTISSWPASARVQA